jgi:hypothetical protein
MTKDQENQLLASAADLLAALQAIVEEVAGTTKPDSTDSWLPQHFVEAARAAIAKAEGLN